jgi:hypothetical protein
LQASQVIVLAAFVSFNMDYFIQRPLVVCQGQNAKNWQKMKGGEKSTRIILRGARVFIREALAAPPDLPLFQLCFALRGGPLVLTILALRSLLNIALTV